MKSVDANGDTIFNDSETANEGTQTVSYQFTVTNTSPSSTDPLTVSAFDDPTLNAAGVTDAALLAAFLAVNPSGVLAPGQSVTFSINDVSLTLDDGTPGSDPFVNTVTVNATDDEGAAASNTDTATINVTAVAPAITVVKSVDANGDTVFNDSETANEGTQTVSYQFTVTNTSPSSTDPLTVSAFDDPTLNAAGVTDAALLAAFTAANGGSAVLAPGAFVTFTINNVSLTLDDGTPGPDPFVNTVTVNAADDEGTAASDTDTATINVNPVAPAITIVKSVDANGNTVFNDSETADEGAQTVSYQFTVRRSAKLVEQDPLTVNAFDDPTLNAAG